MTRDQRNTLASVLSRICGFKVVWQGNVEPEWVGKGLGRLSLVGAPTSEGVSRVKSVDDAGNVREDILGFRRAEVQCWLGYPKKDYAEPLADEVSLALRGEYNLAELTASGVYVRRVNPPSEIPWVSDERPIEAAAFTFTVAWAFRYVDNTPTGLGRIEMVNAELTVTDSGGVESTEEVEIS